MSLTHAKITLNIVERIIIDSSVQTLDHGLFKVKNSIIFILYYPQHSLSPSGFSIVFVAIVEEPKEEVGNIHKGQK